ncbi:DUF6214 family protein [Streptomyces sp. IMTB 2501]|uniref:DUF6214 family protein n=1 Tax=Streptomyces sp. IMTB 2501 TaxID=1776340 RepID=UPI00273CF565|nr:DUF6214 family protein [Streptomyces sp. IMTB 2501]
MAAGSGGVTPTRVRSYGVRSCGYVACVLEASLLNLSDRNAEDGAVSVWPAWKVREHCGTTSWFQVRLAFPDGARVDALAVLHNGCVSIEDVTAQPALSLADLTALANWIEGPLFASCGVAPVRSCADDGDERPAERPEGERPEGQGPEWRPEDECLEERPECEPPGQRQAPEARDSAERREGERPVGRGDDERPERLYEGEPPDGRCEPEARGAAEIALGVGPRRAWAGWPRGIEGRRLVAREYRAAQQGGVDPVLAVMTATGRSRRRSLRMIAQARDDGFLTPRHARRS